MTWTERIRFGEEAVRDIVGRVWPYVVLGIAVGAGIHGYVPEGFLASFMGRSAWWSVPLAVLVGVPMYSNAAGIIPVVQALLGKGAALGTVLAFMMAVIGLSLPEAVILRKVLTLRLLLDLLWRGGLRHSHRRLPVQCGHVEETSMKKIQILGTGCPKCKKLAENVQAAAKDAGIECEIVKVTDINEIMKFGVMLTPALAVDGQVKVVGKVPSPDEIKKMLA